MIQHITRLAEWDAARAAGCYRPPSLAREGFIHGSTAAQTAATAHKQFRGRTDLVLLCIDETRVAAEVRYEPPIAVARAISALRRRCPGAAPVARDPGRSRGVTASAPRRHRW